MGSARSGAVQRPWTKRWPMPMMDTCGWWTSTSRSSSTLSATASFCRYCRSGSRIDGSSNSCTRCSAPPYPKTEWLRNGKSGRRRAAPSAPSWRIFVLHELDVELESRSHKYVRYADDLMVLCRSRKAAERTIARLKPFIEEKLFLQINVEKTKICRITAPELKFLGFGFWAKVRKGDKPLICDRPHQKSLAKCKAQLRDLTSRSRGQSLDVFREKLRRYVVGWAGYFGRASMARFVADANQWLRRRIRMVYWKQWKKPSMRLKALRKLGVPEGRAHEWANSR